MRSLTHLKQKATELRFNGYSYNAIKKELGIKSKGTLSYWFKDIALPPEAQKKLEKNIQRAQECGLLDFNKKRTERIKKENILAYKNGSAMIRDLSPNDLLLIGTCLYWGEGTKAENKHSNLALALSNSDPEMIMVFMKFLRNIFQVDDGKIRAGIHIYPNINADYAKKFWSKITGLPAERFYIVQQVSRSSKGKRAFNRLPHGTAVIKVSNRQLFFRMKGMIKGVVSKITDLNE